MAKKARRGRPPGSKNKKKKAGRVAKAGNYAKMEVGQLRDYIDSLQDVLAKKADSLPGRKVVLCKMALPGTPLRFVYDIHLQEGGRPGPRIGRTTAQFSHDVAAIVSSKGFSLPKSFYNARISDVITCTSHAEGHSDGIEPWATSGFWLGVTLHGLAAGQTFRRKG